MQLVCIQTVTREQRFCEHCCPTCLLEPVQQLLSDSPLQVEVVVLLIGGLQVQRNVLEHEDVFGFGFLCKRRM